MAALKGFEGVSLMKVNLRYQRGKTALICPVPELAKYGVMMSTGRS